MKAKTPAQAYGNIVEHAATGMNMPEAMARTIEELSDGLPKDFTYRRLAKTPTDVEVNAGERTDISYITTDAVDRDGEVVLPGGGDWKNYNRVVTMAHDYKSLPAGSNWWIRPKMKGKLETLVAKTHFPTKPADWGDVAWLPSAILHLQQQPVPTCTGKSIGFLPMNIRHATAEEKAARPDWKDCPIIDKWVGIEYAVAPVPANDQSEMIAVSKAVKGGIEAGLFDARTADVLRTFLSLKDMGDGEDTESMPSCPKCQSPDMVSKKDDGYTCSMCGDFVPPGLADAKPVSSPAKSIVTISPDAVAVAIKAQILAMAPSLMDSARKQAREAMRDSFYAARGRVSW